MRNSADFTAGEAIDRIFRALGDPHRIQIIELLREKELSAGEILAALDVVQSTLSHHMKTLSDSGAVNALRRGKWTYYSLNESVLAQACAFLEECAKGTRVRKAQPEGTPPGEAKGTPPGEVKTHSPHSASKEASAKITEKESRGEDNAKGVFGGQPGPRPEQGEKQAAQKAADVNKAQSVPEKTGKKKDKEKDKKSKKNKKNKK